VKLNWIKVVEYGLITGLAIAYVCLVGMVEAFDERDIISGILTLGWALMIVISLSLGYLVAWKVAAGHAGRVLISSLIAGLIGSLLVAGLALIIEPLNLRSMFVNASPALVKLLTFAEESKTTGAMMLIGSLTGLSLLGGLIYLLPARLRRGIIVGLGTILLIGMLTELLEVILSRFELGEELVDLLFAREGLSTSGTLIIFSVVAVLNILWGSQKQVLKTRVSALSSTQQRAINWALIVLSVLLLFLLPQIVGPYISQILVLVGLYALMGLGLNIEIGLAGLLDLGFVGFFAIGAYTVALITSTSQLGLSNVASEAFPPDYTNFWIAVPIAILVSAIAGVLLGIPVLRMRGDYLAIVTLGFAEIIRILVLSDFLRPALGGAQGVLNIPKPSAATFSSWVSSFPDWLQRPFYFIMSQDGLIKDPGNFYYLIVVGCVIVAFIAWRLQNARAGRNWIAMREDEDVAEAMGINLVASKLLAFGIGAAFAGLSGAIFAAQVGSVFPHSFGLIVSINVVSLVIIGGSGSIPGVIIGSLALVGLPELLREFTEFRLLIYGALLVAMMLIRPEGLWPSEVNRRELHREEPEPVPVAQQQQALRGQQEPATHP
jgi:branched-chain amino acid transport system permease protein